MNTIKSDCSLDKLKHMFVIHKESCKHVYDVGGNSIRIQLHVPEKDGTLSRWAINVFFPEKDIIRFVGKKASLDEKAVERVIDIIEFSKDNPQPYELWNSSEKKWTPHKGDILKMLIDEAYEYKDVRERLSEENTGVFRINKDKRVIEFEDYYGLEIPKTDNRQ
ncbi:hypothetical protein UFOVP1597_38 [uncultured Caudovirales phage]|uniref:Uncharacterized protein n=1 Tax=uncultured Caudovirales phage TaxID=2100421 RepID=A0A6J5STI5_9CAUD|nr:hypothetical protein UFOVP1597_38 [uncultured Caudovirales phage]